MPIGFSFFYITPFLYSLFYYYSDDRARSLARPHNPQVDVQILTVGKERVVQARDAPLAAVDDAGGPRPRHLASSVGLDVCVAGASRRAASIRVLATAGPLHCGVWQAPSRGLWQRRRRRRK